MCLITITITVYDMSRFGPQFRGPYNPTRTESSRQSKFLGQPLDDDYVPSVTESSHQSEEPGENDSNIANMTHHSFFSTSSEPMTSQYSAPFINLSHDNSDVPEEDGVGEDSWMNPSAFNVLTTLTTVNVLLSICCIILSILIAYCRIRSSPKRSLVQVLYLQIGLTDFFVGIGVLSQCPILYLLILRGREVSDVNIPVFFTYMVTAVAVKMSVFMNCALGAVRCINIVRPFYQINKKALKVITLLFMVSWITIAGIDVWQFAEKRQMKNRVFLVKTFVLKGQPGFGIFLQMEEANISSYVAYHLGNVVKFIIPTALPSLLCFILMVVQVNHLFRQRAKKKRGSMNRRSASDLQEGGESKASLTIFLLTLIYVGTSAVSILTWLIVSGSKGYLGSKSTYEALIEEGRKATSWSDLTAIYFSLSTCPLICSTLTPLTLLLRGSGPMSKHARKVFAKDNNSQTNIKSKDSTQTLLSA